LLKNIIIEIYKNEAKLNLNFDNTTKIMSKDLEEIKKLLVLGKIHVCIVGIGRIGLPTALSFANSNLPTIGVDINTDLVNMINSGEFPLKDEPGYDLIFNNVLKNKIFHATTKLEEAVSKSDVILLSLPTPIDESQTPNYSALEHVCKKLGMLISPGSLIIVESTVEPGFVENTLTKILNENNNLILGKDFGLGVCPETANPGEILKDFHSLPRLVGALDEKTADIILEIYKHVFPVELIKMPNCKTANAVKLTTNVFRYINIAFVNELAILCENLGIDIMKVLEAADLKYNFQIHYPGPGVGGPCLPANSTQILHSGKMFGNNLLKMVSLSQEINDGMSSHVIFLTQDGLKKVGKNLENSQIVILGVSYKPNVKDIQITPAEPIIKKLQELGAKIKIYDPYFKSDHVFGIKVDDNFSNAISGADAVILITAHDEFRNLELSIFVSKMQTPVVVDTRGIIDIYAAKKAGLIYRGIGRGGN
jgi:nucleotide sugar dehydrogenase